MRVALEHKFLLNFREENEYFSFMKNIPWVILGFLRERKLNERWMGHLGENQDMPKCLSPFKLIQNPKFKAKANEVRKKREGKIQAVTNLPHLG